MADRAKMMQALAEAKARSKRSALTAEKPGDFKMDWADVGKSTASGIRSGLESTLGSLGDIGTMQQALASYGARKLGLDPEKAASLAKYTSPFSLGATTEDVSGASDKLLGRDEITRHEATTPEGKHANVASNLLSGLIGGPENLGKDVGLKLAMSMVPAAKLARRGFGKIGEEIAESGTKTMFHGVQKPKLDRPLEDMTATYEKTHDLKPDKPISYEDLHGGVLLGMPGDRTIAGYNLTGINDVPFEKPVPLEGGFRFAQGPAQEKGIGWASGVPQISRMANDVKKAAAANPGKDIYGTFLPMGPESGDFSSMQYDAMMELLRKQPPTAEAAAALDEVLKAKMPGSRKVPSFPGINALIEGGGTDFSKFGVLRSQLAKELAKAGSTQHGIPQIGQSRWAITEPELLNTPNFAGGQTVVKFNPEGRWLRDPDLHGSYPAGIEGEQIGRLPETGYEKLYSTWNAGVDPAIKGSNKEGKFRLELPAQQADDEWLKNLLSGRR